MTAGVIPHSLPQELGPLLRELPEVFCQALGNEASGLWVCGAAARDCWNPRRSGLELLGVAEAHLDASCKLLLLNALESLWPLAPAGGLEITIVLRDIAVRPFLPAPYEFHYSPGWRGVFRREPLSLCTGVYRTDRELVLSFADVRVWGIPLLGPSAKELFSLPEHSDLMAAILHRARRMAAFLEEDPTPSILELCRGLAFAREGLVLSREEGGRWACAHLPQWKWLICRALEDYAGCYHYRAGDAGSAFSHLVLAELENLAAKSEPPASPGSF